MRVVGTPWRCSRGSRRHFLPPIPSSLCCLGGAALLFNLLSLYLLHTSPSRWMHAHGGVLPRRQVALPFGGFEPPGGWDRLGNVRCRPLRFLGTDLLGSGGRAGQQKRMRMRMKMRMKRRMRRMMMMPRALASAPGSGNTWLRHLLQQATGLLTGSMYNDTFLMTSGFPGEGISNGSVLVVKTHDAHPDVQRHFLSAILLVRRPRDAILAEFHRLHGGHLGQATPKDFQKDWKTFVIEAAKHWATFNTEWLLFSGPLHIVHYEDLQRDLNATLSATLRFLNVTVTAQDLECAVQHSGHGYKRQKKKMAGGFSDKELFSEEVLSVLEQSERRFKTALHEYLKKRKASETS